MRENNNAEHNKINNHFLKSEKDESLPVLYQEKQAAACGDIKSFIQTVRLRIYLELELLGLVHRLNHHLSSVKQA